MSTLQVLGVRLIPVSIRNDHCVKSNQWRHNLFYRSYVFLTSLQLCVISFPLCFWRDQKWRNEEIGDLTVVGLFFTFGVFSHWKSWVSWLVLLLECWIMILITFPKAETHIKQENLQFHFGRICPYENFLGGKVGHASSIRFCCRTCLIILYTTETLKRAEIRLQVRTKLLCILTLRKACKRERERLIEILS